MSENISIALVLIPILNGPCIDGHGGDTQGIISPWDGLFERRFFSQARGGRVQTTKTTAFGEISWRCLFRGFFTGRITFSRDGSGQNDPARPAICEKLLTQPDPARPDPCDFEHLLTRPDSTREFLQASWPDPRAGSRTVKSPGLFHRRVARRSHSLPAAEKICFENFVRRGLLS